MGTERESPVSGDPNRYGEPYKRQGNVMRVADIIYDSSFSKHILYCRLRKRRNGDFKCLILVRKDPAAAAAAKT